MKKTLMYLAALAVAIAPAVFGVWGNASFARSVDLPTPSSTTITRTATPVDDHGTSRHEKEARDDRGRRHGADDASGHTSGHHAEPGDDNGGRRTAARHGADDASGHHTSAQHEAGDDEGGRHGGHREAGDDRSSGGHGSDD